MKMKTGRASSLVGWAADVKVIPTLVREALVFQYFGLISLFLPRFKNHVLHHNWMNYSGLQFPPWV
jgi:hypothetical protein